ncbi:man(5)GlcNAc(2)-PP-dolichol translocation protein RFT1-like [Dendrobates tinctorius]|uniref:man(5)GlcNAc(2)-PP-dolichol translocation protein RFT1-like n=1 Tax=Dendrobates tinctorius TaxID=92724 RepID=UPI003CC9874B
MGDMAEYVGGPRSSDYPTLWHRGSGVWIFCSNRTDVRTVLGPCTSSSLCQAEVKKVKVIAESLAIIVRCSVTVTLVLLWPQWGLLIFALAQVLYTSLLSLCYIVYFTKFLGSREAEKKSFPLHSMMEFLPRRSVSQVSAM